MKTLVIFYSMHEHTKKVARQIRRILHAKIEEVKDTKDRSNLKDWSQGAFDEELRTKTKIEETKYDPKEFDLVVIGTPIWDGVSPAIRAYLSQNKFKKVAFFSTFGSAAEDASYKMSKLAKKKPLATLELQDRQIDNKEYKEKIIEFCKEIKRKR